jgi:hypothetical protein
MIFQGKKQLGSGRMSVKKALVLLGIFLLGAVNASAAGQGETINFKYQLETGMKFGYQLTVKTDTTQKILDEVIPRDEEWQIQYQITVLSGSGNRGGALLRVTYDSIFYRLDSPFQQYSRRLTPDDANLPERLKPYANLIGTDFKIYLLKTPKIEVNAQTDHPADPEDFNLLQFFSSLSPNVTSVKYLFPNLIGNIFVAYPNASHKFKANDHWLSERCLTNGQFAPKLKTEARITAIDAERIHVGLGTASGCKYQNEQSVMHNKLKLAKVVSVLTGSLEGQLEIAKDSKLPMNGMINLDLAGTVKRFETEAIPVTVKMAIRYQLQ